MTEQDRIVARWYGFFAGERKPDTIYVLVFRKKSNDPAAPIICFLKKDDPEVWIFGTFTGKRIVPVEDRCRPALQNLGNAILRQGNYPVRKFRFLETQIMTALSMHDFDNLCNEVGATDTVKPTDADSLKSTVSAASTNKKGNLKHWQYAALVIGITSFLSLVYGRQLVWADFFLLDGTFLRAQFAAWLYAAWCVPLTLFHAFVAPKHRGVFTIIILGFAPLAIRQLSLLRNYSIALMWIYLGIVILLAGATFYHSMRIKKRLLSALEKARNVGALALMFVFTVTLFVDLFVPTISTRKIESVIESSEPQTRQVSQADLDMLSSTKYDTLPVEERARILFAVMEEMSDTLGISTPDLIVEADMRNNMAACYDARDNTIYIWKAYLRQSPAPAAVDTILHELFHSFQHNVIASTAIDWDSPDLHRNAAFERLLQWKQEIESYIGSDRWDETWEAYANQALETDADAFAHAYNEHFINYEKLITEIEGDIVSE